MNENEDYDMPDRGESEALSKYTGIDDGCNHLPSLIWQMRSRANLRLPYQPKPKPVYCVVEDVALQTDPKKYYIGKRTQYSRNVFICIYQLNRRGMNEKVMSENLGIPLQDIRRILQHETNVQSQAWRYIHQQPITEIPGIPEILRRIQREDENAINTARDV